MGARFPGRRPMARKRTKALHKQLHKDVVAKMAMTLTASPKTPRQDRWRACQLISLSLGGYCRSDWLANSNSGDGAVHNYTPADNASEAHIPIPAEEFAAGIPSWSGTSWSRSRRHSRRKQRAREPREYRRKASTSRNPPCQPVCKRFRRPSRHTVTHYACGP